MHVVDFASCRPVKSTNGSPQLRVVTAYSFNMSAVLRTTRLQGHVRCLATASGSSPSKSAFRATLEAGPSFEEFLSGRDKERVVLRNTLGYVNPQNFTCI